MGTSTAEGEAAGLDPKQKKLLGRLGRLSAGRGVPLGSKEVIAVREAAAAALCCRPLYLALFRTLLQMAIDLQASRRHASRRRDASSHRHAGCK